MYVIMYHSKSASTLSAVAVTISRLVSDSRGSCATAEKWTSCLSELLYWKSSDRASELYT